GTCGVVREKIGDPYDLCQSIRLRQRLRRSVVVRKRSAARRPDKATFGLVDGDDQLAHDHTVAERHDTRTRLEMCVGYEPWHQAGVKGANIAQRVPDVVRGCLGENFLAYRGHFCALRFR